MALCTKFLIYLKIAFIKRNFYECSSLKQISIPSSVTSVGKNHFAECKNLNQMIIIPCNEKYIEFIEDRFLLCKNCGGQNLNDTIVWTKPMIDTATIPPFIKVIGYSAFTRCTFLKQILIPPSVTQIEDYFFEGCSILKEISITSSVTSIGNYAFSECSSLTQISIARNWS